MRSKWRMWRDPQISVALKTSTPVIKRGELPKLEAEVVNGRETGVTLVTPGEGSSAVRRTPVIEWFVDDLPESRPAAAGSLPALRADEVASLGPGQRLPLGTAVGAPRLGVGKHKLVLRYTNAPDLKWGSASPAGHDAVALAKVQASTRVTAESNAVEITVVD